MQTRRKVIAGLAGAGLAPPRALAQGPGAGFDAAMERVWKEGRYLPLLTLGEGEVDPNFRGVIDQARAWWGDEAGALRDAASRPAPAPDLAGAEAQDAIAAVVSASAGRRVVMLNEAHTASRHRLFLAQLLRALRREGFTHLAAETFANDPASAADAVAALGAGSQLTSAHGFYLVDPVFAEATREALALGYRLASYEARMEPLGSETDPLARIAAREAEQAANLAEHLKRWPQARFVVYVGYSHLDERPEANAGPWFAARLPTVAGIDPLTIGQAHSGSFGPHAPDAAITRAVLNRFAPTGPVVVTRQGRAVADPRWPGEMTVYHPRLADIAGRPGWLAADPGRRRVAVRLPREASAGPVLVQALHATDKDPAVPADQYRPPRGARSATLFLRPGRYRVRLETAAGFTSVGEVAA